MGALDDLKAKYYPARGPQPEADDHDPADPSQGNAEQTPSLWRSFNDKLKPFAQSIENADLARDQDVRPEVMDRDGSYAHTPLGEASFDENDLVYFTDASGSSVQANKKDHVVLRDPSSGRMLVFARNPKWNEGNYAQAARAMAQGFLTGPVVRGTAAAPAGSASAARQAAAAEAAEDLAATERLGVRPFGPAFSQSRPIAATARQLSEMPFLGGPTARALDDSLRGAAEATEDVASRYGTVATPEAAGRVTQEGIERFRDARPFEVIEQEAASLTPAQRSEIIRQPARDTSLKAKQAALYERAWSYLPEEMKHGRSLRDLPRIMGDMPETRAVIDDVTERNLQMMNSSRVSRETAAKAPSEFLETRQGGVPTKALPVQGGILGEAVKAIYDGNWRGALQTMRNIRSDFRRLSSGMADTERNVLKHSDIDRIESAITRDMIAMLQRNVETYRKAGSEDIAANMEKAIREFRRADKFTALSMQRMDAIEKLFQAPNATALYRNIAASALTGSKGDIEKIRVLAKTLREDEMQDLAGAVLREMGHPVGSARGISEKTGHSVATFMTNWNKMSDEAKHLLFRGEHAAAVDDLVRANDRLANVEALANTSRTTSNAMGVGAIATTGAAMASGIDAITSILAPAGLLWGTSLILANPRYANWAVRYANARAKGAAAADMAAHINRLRVMAQSDPQLAPIASAFAEAHGVRNAEDSNQQPNAEARRDKPQQREGEDTGSPRQENPLNFEDAEVLEGEAMTPPMPRRASGGVVEDVLPGRMSGDSLPQLAPWVLEAEKGYDPTLSEPASPDNWQPFQGRKPKMTPMTPEEKQRLRDMIRQEGERLRRDYPEFYQRMNPERELPPGSNLNLGDHVEMANLSLGAGQYADGGVAKPYDYTPDSEFSTSDMARYLAGRAARRDGTAGIGNRLSAEIQSRMSDEPVDDVLRQYKSADDAFSTDYPVTSTATDIGASVLGGVGAVGAMKGTGSIGSRLMSAPMNYNFKNPFSAAIPPAAATLGDTYLNEPDAEASDYIVGGLASGAATLPILYGTGLAMRAADDLMDLGQGVVKRFRGETPQGNANLGDAVKEDPLAGLSPAARELTKKSRVDEVIEELAQGRAERRLWEKTKPSVYKKPREYYHPDMPDAPANNIELPKGRGYQEPSRADRDVEFFSETYTQTGDVPSYIAKIRQNSASQYINERGQYVPLTDAKLYENMRKRGLLGKDGPQPAPADPGSPKLPKPKKD